MRRPSSENADWVRPYTICRNSSRMAVLMASHTRSVFSASRMVLPGRISLAMAAEWVMPEQPTVSTSASSMTPFLTFRDSLQAPCWGAHQPMPWV